MVESNKILTVSYGTFSCTLEGFDDAFETMKAIAEYFRDLAADDRFFGAEPPTPDAETMARIAERGSRRRVEAQRSDDGIVLRSSDRDEGTAALPAAAAQAAPAPSGAEAPAPESNVEAQPPQAAPAPEQPAAARPAPEQPGAAAEQPATQAGTEPAPEVTPAVAEIDTPEVEMIDPAPAAPAEDLVSKLRRIRSVVSRTRVEPAAEYEDDVEGDYTAPGTLDMSSLYDATVTPASGESDEDRLDAPMSDDEEMDPALAFTADDIPADEGESAEVADAEEAEVADAESEDFADETEVSPELVADDGGVAEIDGRDEETPSETATDDFGPETYDEDIVEDDAIDAGHTAYESDDEDDIFAEDDSLSADEVDALPEVDDASLWSDADTDFAANDDTQDDTIDGDEAEMAEGPEATAAEETGQPEHAPTLARVVKVKRREPQPSALSPEEEADLQAELAEVEAELTGKDAATLADAEEDSLSGQDAAQVPDSVYEDYDNQDAAEAGEQEGAYEEDDTFEADHDDAAYADDEGEAWDAEDEAAQAQDDDAEWQEALTGDPDAQAPVTPRRPAAGRAKLDASTTPGDMDRILAETNNQLGETEGTRRRSAIRHLRAAVAATKAEKQAGTDLDSAEGEDSTDAYRQDLAQVVRPRRPRAGGTPQRREEKAAPLRLVAEQRVDLEAAHRDPVRPRRVSVADLIRREGEAEDHAEEAPIRGRNEGFASFLADSGAEELNEVIEAAAAYLAFVEGREQFSRPQLMGRVREIDPEGYSREDALRAFGTLLREGKIRKVKGGRFTVSDRIGYHPDQRAVG